MKKSFLKSTFLAGAILTICSCSTNKMVCKDNASSVVIVYYDSEVGSSALETTIKQEKCEVIYRYINFNAFALKIPDISVKEKLVKTKGVLSVQDDRVMELQ